MESSLGACVAAFLVAFALVLAGRHYWREVHGIAEEGPTPPEFRRWLHLGLAFPLAWWFVWNLVAFLLPRSGFPPLLATGPLPGSPSTWPALFAGNAAVLAVFLALAWAAITFLWLLPVALRQLPEGESYRPTALAISGLALLLLIWPLWRGSVGGAVFVVAAWAWALLHTAEPEARPSVVSYGRAVAHLKFGRYEQAEQAVLSELEKKDDDPDGWLMLAEMYAEHFGEVGEAERTVRELCEQPGVSPYQVAHAFNRLADWQLRLADDPVAARRTLGEIVARLPDTPFATQAGHRLRELPLSREEARQRRGPRTIRLPALSEGTGEAAPGKPTAEQKSALREQAARLSERLEIYPDQTAVRERLARVLTEGLGDLDAGIRHLRVLLESADASAPRRAEWLGLQASWLFRYRRDEARGREILEQIVREHPASPQALAARRQLHLLDQPPEPPAAERPPPPRIVVKLDAPNPNPST